MKAVPLCCRTAFTRLGARGARCSTVPNPSALTSHGLSVAGILWQGTCSRSAFAYLSSIMDSTSAILPVTSSSGRDTCPHWGHLGTLYLKSRLRYLNARSISTISTLHLAHISFSPEADPDEPAELPGLLFINLLAIEYRLQFYLHPV